MINRVFSDCIINLKPNQLVSFFLIQYKNIERRY